MKAIEVQYYNALNALLQGDHSKLKKRWDKFHNWKKAWESEGKSLDIKEWQKLEELGINLLLNSSPQFPEGLKNIPFSPFGIYKLGNLNYAKPALAIVGTRRATPQGKELARQFARRLSAAKISIISGLAMGIDEAAHQGALDEKGQTVAVLGTPLNYIYPRQNQKLAEAILKNGGAIISEFPLGQEFRRQNFLIRNRIISGLADAVLVIEAPERSGALATARFALDQGKDVFVIPGDISSPNYKGSNELIKAGAAPATGPNDLLEYFGVSSENPRISSAGGKTEDLIVATLKENGRLAVDQLAKIVSLSGNELNKNLAMLTIKGIIKENNGKYSLAE